MRTLAKITISLILISALALGQSTRTVFNAQNVAPSGGAAPTVLQSGSCDTTSATCSFTFTSPVGAGHYLGCYAGGNGNTVGASCTMTGETISKIANASNGAGFQGDFYLSTNTVGGQTVITCTMSTGSGGKCVFFEATSPSSGKTLDASGNGQSTTTAISVATSTNVSNASDLCLGFAYSSFGSPGFTLGSGWASVQNVFSSAGSIILESKVSGVTGTTVTATATTPGSTNSPEGIACLLP